MSSIKLVVFDMAGTTVRDEQEVEKCFEKAALESNLPYTNEEIIGMMGWSKQLVFETLWKKAQPEASPTSIQDQTDISYKFFTEILESHYETNEVVPTEGCLDLFNWLRENDIKTALTTGFYRKVTNIILNKLGWNKGLDNNYLNGEIIDFSVTSDEVKLGRPHPFMISKCMEVFNIKNSAQVIKIGDTPSDLGAGKNANCLKSYGVVNGTHTREQLSFYDNDGLFKNLSEFQKELKNIVG